MPGMWLFGASSSRSVPQPSAQNSGNQSRCEDELDHATQETPKNTSRHRKLIGWVFGMAGHARQRHENMPDAGGELQIMLPNETLDEETDSGDICLLTESPYRIFRIAETGTVKQFLSLYLRNPSRLKMTDSRGRTVAHQSASRNNINVLNFIKEQGGDLKAQDKQGNTPLHIAVEAEAFIIIEYLLNELGTDSEILNNKFQAPIHLATEMNKVEILQIFVKYKDKVNVNLGGEHGRTALHLAAIHDYDICAKILLTEMEADWKQPCNNGYYPIHEAAKHASSKTMEVFLQHGETKGYPRDAMISVFDNEGNIPLHSAVHGGGSKAVELCIKSGAKISTQQDDHSTPVHFACSQGALHMLQLMFTLQPEEINACLNARDIQKMTPIHCAAVFNHTDIVKYLVANGSDLNPLDKEGRTPLLLAASRGAWQTVEALIQLGADVQIKDIALRNILHIVIDSSQSLEELANICGDRFPGLFNEKDIDGCTPLHFATIKGNIKSLENLISMGASLNLKDKNEESPLHFAARYGRYGTICKLLNNNTGVFILNNTNGEGMTPLHIAAWCGHNKVVQMLLNKGALLHRDHNGRNPLHLAAMGGHPVTIELLHTLHSHLLNQEDKDGNSALHLAAIENKPAAIALLLSMGCLLKFNNLSKTAIDYAIHFKFPMAALAMVTHEERGKEIMMLRSKETPSVTLALIATMPRVFEAVLDKCITKADCKKDSKSFYVKYDFDIFRSKLQDNSSKKPDSESKLMDIPLFPLNAMVSHGRVELLAHPLTKKYLQVKWNSYGKYFHLANILSYAVFLLFMTLYISVLVVHTEPKNEVALKNNTNNTNNDTGKPAIDQPSNINITDELLKKLEEDVELQCTMYTCTVVVLVYNTLSIIYELYNIKQQKWHYFLDAWNILAWVLYGCSTVTVLPTLTGNYRRVPFHAAAITIFLSWLKLLLLLERFDPIGLYVVMFIEMVQTFIQVVLVFSIVIIAFSLAFYVLLGNGGHLGFRGFLVTFIHMFSMMLGEIDFVSTYVAPVYRESSKVYIAYPVITFMMLTIFILTVPVIMMNLMIGLAIGDIESVKNNAQLKRLAMQVVLHTELERKLPAFILAKVDKTELIEYPNSKIKISFCDMILRKWFCNPFNDDNKGDLDHMMDNSDDYTVIEMEDQDTQWSNISNTLQQQTKMMTLIAQKMDITTEADDEDEGVTLSQTRYKSYKKPFSIHGKFRTGHSNSKGV